MCAYAATTGGTVPLVLPSSPPTAGGSTSTGQTSWPHCMLPSAKHSSEVQWACAVVQTVVRHDPAHAMCSPWAHLANLADRQSCAIR